MAKQTGKFLDFKISETTKENRQVRLTDTSLSNLLEKIRSKIKSRSGFALATINLDHIVKLRTDSDFLEAYLDHQIVVADGNPIVWLWKAAGQKVELIPGSELILPIAKICEEEGGKVAFFGSDEETLSATEKSLMNRFPNLQIVYRKSPAWGFDPTSQDADTYLSEINKSKAQICFLALGAPKQEILAARGIEHAPECGFVSIGAGLDFIGGKQTRAPAWVRKIAMEWLWRLLSNPKRLFLRYFKCALILPGLFFSAFSSRKK